MENGPFINDVPIKIIKTSTYKGFSMAMLVITRWYHLMSQVSILLSAESVPYQKVKATFDAHRKHGSSLITEVVPNMIHSSRLTYSTGTEPIFKGREFQTPDPFSSALLASS